MKIYTKRGDTGETDLFGGARVSKAHVRVKAYGDIDNACSAIGLAYSAPHADADLKKALKEIMILLFCAGAEVALAPKENSLNLLKTRLKNQISDDHITMLEQAIDEMDAKLAPLKSFILPCGSDVSGRLHVARTQVRRAEISLIELELAKEAVRPEIKRFFNRLSDYLFVSARLQNAKSAVDDILWSGNL
jgi:cob(I)alamin adenosyltransferase